jgi:hypothetical protein
MRLRVIAILAILIASLILLGAAQTPDYTGKAKIVMKLTKMPDMPAMPQAGSTSSFAETATTFGVSIPQGTMLQGEVLYSSDPAVKAGQTYSLYINYDPNNEPLGFQSGLVDQLKSGAVVGINDYAVQGNQVTVNVGTSLNWKSKVFILDTQYINPSESKNPFMINLNAFKSFNDMPAYNYSTSLKPMFNMSDWGGNSFPAFNSSLSGLHSIGFPDIFSHLFG